MFAEHLRIFGLLFIALTFWLIPACYPMRKHEQGISLAVALTATLALIRYSKIAIEEEIYEQNYQLMETELRKTELAHYTAYRENQIQQAYSLETLETFPVETETLPGNISTRFHSLPGNVSAISGKHFHSLPATVSTSRQGSNLSIEDQELLTQIKQLKREGLSATAIVRSLWNCKSGRKFQIAMKEYKRLTGE